MPVLERTMKTMRLADDVVTFSTLRKTMAECFQRNSRTRRPLLVTQNGVASKVIIDVADFDNIRETLELMDDLFSAEAELDRGEFTTQEDEIREAHAERERIKWTFRSRSTPRPRRCAWLSLRGAAGRRTSLAQSRQKSPRP